MTDKSLTKQFADAWWLAEAKMYFKKYIRTLMKQIDEERDYHYQKYGDSSDDKIQYYQKIRAKFLEKFKDGEISGKARAVYVEGVVGITKALERLEEEKLDHQRNISYVLDLENFLLKQDLDMMSQITVKTENHKAVLNSIADRAIDFFEEELINLKLISRLLSDKDIELNDALVFDVKEEVYEMFPKPQDIPPP